MSLRVTHQEAMYDRNQGIVEALTAVQQRSKTILMEMDQQIADTELRLTKMKTSREAASLAYTKLFAHQAQAPIEVQQEDLAVPEGEGLANPKVAVLQLLIDEGKPVALAHIREGIGQYGAAVSNPHLFDVLKALIKAKKVRRTDRGVYAVWNCPGKRIK